MLKVGQNIKYDMRVLERHGIAIGAGRRHDADLLRARRRHARPRHGRAGRALSRPEDRSSSPTSPARGAKQVTLRQGADRARHATTPPRTPTSRCSSGQQLKPRLRRAHGDVYETIERPLIPVLLGDGAGRHQGRRATLRTLSADFEKRMGELEHEIHKLAGREFNVGSPKQLGEILFDEMKLPRRQAQQDRRLGDRRRRCWRSSPRRAIAAGARSSSGASCQAQVHLYRRAGARARPRDRPRPHLLSR